MIEYEDGTFDAAQSSSRYYFSDQTRTVQISTQPGLHAKRAKRKKRKVWYLAHSKLSPSVYKTFIDVALGRLDLGKEETNIKKVIRSLTNTGELGVAKNVNHAILGHMEYAIMHLASHKLVLHSEQRSQVVEHCIQTFARDVDPVGASMNFIEENFFAFGDKIRIRDQILKRLKIYPFESQGKEVHQVYEADNDNILRFFEEAELQESYKPQPGTSTEVYVEAVSHPKPKFNIKEPVYHPDKDLTKDAILDEYHDILYELLIGTIGVDEVLDENLKEYLFPELWRWLLPEEVDEAGDELVHGFRIRRKSDSRIMLKTSESELIWHLAKQKLGSMYSNDQISFYVLEKYVGAAPCREFCDPFSTILLRGPQIVFPKPPPTIGSAPMKYVQIDVIEMPLCRFNGREYTNVLVIVDLYSNFLFVKALVGVPEPDKIVRHLVDVFGSFSVPEGFRSGSPHKALSVAINDIRSMFDVNISYLGLGSLTPFLVREEIIKRSKSIGRENSWVEVLPSTIIHLNQKPHRAFDSKFSAFEVMFKRRPWKQQNFPPWLTAGKNENLGKMEIMAQEDFECTLSRFLKKKKPILSKSGELLEPETGFLFKPGDYVYIKNPCYQDQPEIVAKEVRVDNPRYFRAVVTKVDTTNTDFPYRVRYWDQLNQDNLSANSWPDPGARETRIYVYDIVGSTPRLSYLRNTIFTKFVSLNEAPTSANPICISKPTKTTRKNSTKSIQAISIKTHSSGQLIQFQPYTEPEIFSSLKPMDRNQVIKVTKKKKFKKKTSLKKERSAEEEEQMKRIEEILKSTFKWKPIPGDNSKQPSTSKAVGTPTHNSNSEITLAKINSNYRLVPTEKKSNEPLDYVRSLVRKSLYGNYRSPRMIPYPKPILSMSRGSSTLPGTIRIIMPRILASNTNAVKKT